MLIQPSPVARLFLKVLAILCLAGCQKQSGDGVVISKEYIAAAVSPAESATPDRVDSDEITVDSYAMPREARGTGRDPRALKDERWLVKVQLIENGRTFNVPADRSQFDKIKEGDRVRVRYRVGKYTGTVWAAELAP